VLAVEIHEEVLIDMGYIQPRVELEGHVHTHVHSDVEYKVNQRTGKCWFCGEIVEPKQPVKRGQLTIEQSKGQLQGRLL